MDNGEHCEYVSFGRKTCPQLDRTLVEHMRTLRVSHNKEAGEGVKNDFGKVSERYWKGTVRFERGIQSDESL